MNICSTKPDVALLLEKANTELAALFDPLLRAKRPSALQKSVHLGHMILVHVSRYFYSNIFKENNNLIKGFKGEQSLVSDRFKRQSVTFHDGFKQRSAIMTGLP